VTLVCGGSPVRHEKGNVLFDTGYYPAAAEDPQARWGGLAKMMMPIMRNPASTC
jgi:hypothetical protein